MADNTIIQQGTFTSAGLPRILNLRSDVDWMEINNLTGLSMHKWQRGMTAGTGLYTATDGTIAAIAAPLGFTPIDTTTVGLGAAIATTAIPDTATPVVATANTASLATAMLPTIRIFHTAWPHLSGLDIAVSVINNTSFTFLSTLATASGVVGGAGTWRLVATGGTAPVFSPRRHIICNITSAVNPTVSTLNYHGLTVGQTVRLSVPLINGMTQANGALVTVLTVPTTTTFTCDLDTTAFTAFAFPTAAQAPTLYATLTPVGEAVNAAYVNLLDDATVNNGVIGMYLGAGAVSSAGGQNNDVIYWRAGKAFNQ